jgi:undecaprenyl-diphosphatase
MAGPGSADVEIATGAAAIDAAVGAAVVEAGGLLQRLLSADQALLLSLRRFRRPWRTLAARALTALGTGRGWTAAGLACLATRTPLGVRLGLRLAAGAGLATAGAQALKRSLGRARPDVAIAGFEALAPNPDRFSFPSGHAAAAFAVAAAFAGEPFALGPLSLFLAAAIALARVYLGAHYPLDAGLGAVLGLLAGALARLLVP